MFHRVEGLPKDDFLGGPGCVSLAELLGGYGLLAVCVFWVIGKEHLVYGVEKVA